MMIKFSRIAIWLLFLCTALPIIILAYFNHPSVADDYCFAYMTRDYGFWKAQKFYYEGWSGRYISNLIFHATPLSYGALWFFKVMPLLILGLLFHAVYVFIGEVLKPSKIVQTTLSIAFLSIYIIFSVGVVDSFFWYTSVFIFPISLCYFLYLLVVILRYYQPQYQRIKYAIALLAATLVFFVVGSNEVMLLFVIAFLGMVWGYILLFKKRFDSFIFTLILVGAYFAYFWVIKAEGVQIRMGMGGGSVLGSSMLVPIKNALQSTLVSCVKWSLFVIPFGYFYLINLPKPESIKAIFKVNIWIIILGVLLSVFVMFFVIHYGSVMGVPDRVKNTIFVVFILGFFYVLTIFRYHYSIEIPYKFRNKTIQAVFALIIIVTIGLYGKNLRIMYADIRLGIAKRYDQEMIERYAQINQSKSDTVYLSPIKNIPKSLCFDELKADEKYLWNKCYATYFEKKVIILKE